MFNNLIESSSHAKEFKRRGSFLLFTTATYVLLFVITGVVSIYAYDARLEDQSLEVIMLPPPQELTPEPEAPRTVRDESRDRSRDTHNNETFDVRRTPTAAVDQPQVAPVEVSTKPNPDLPVRTGVQYRIGNHDSNADLSGGRTGVPSGMGPIRIVEDLEPPPAPAPSPVKPKVLRVSRVLNSQAISLPKPSYPIIAKQTRTQGTVSVQVLIDKTGRVVSAKAVSGHPFLVPEAQKAALQARFSATLIDDQPVKVSGVITYNFVMNQ